MAGRLSRETRAGALVGRQLGVPPVAHQLHILQRASERDPDGGPGYASEALLIIAPRQVAKTTSVLLLLLGRMLSRRGYACKYTAQTGIVTTHVYANPGNGWMTLVDTYLPDVFTTSRSQGREAIVARHNPGAYLAAFPPTPGRLRSNSLDAVVMDECQEHAHAIGNALLADAGPTFTTRPRRQLILMGSAGAADTWWRAQYDRAAAGDYGLIELGTWPADADIEDPAVWRAHHPGIAAGMTDEAHLRSQLAMLGPERFAREYGNRWTTAGGDDMPIADDVWRAALVSVPPPAPAAVAVDAAESGTTGVLVAAGAAPDGRVVAGIADLRPGVAWMAAAVRDIRRKHPRVTVVGDPGGPAGGTLAALEAAGVPVQHHTGAQRNAAPGHFASLLASGGAAVLGHPALEGARLAARRRFTEGGAWIWSRRSSEGDISPLTGATMAVWAASRPAAPRPRTRSARPV